MSSHKHFLFALLLFAAYPGLARAAVASVAIVSAPQSIAPDTVSGQFTLQARDESGLSTTISQTRCLLLQSSSPQGQFSSSATNWNSLSVLTMSKGTANKNFYYQDSAQGSYAITVRLVLKPEEESRSCAAWPTTEWGAGWSASQTVVVGSPSAGSAPAPAPQAPSPSASSAFSGTLPGISARITSAHIVSAGAGSLFEGAAFGEKGEPLTSGVRYLWNFGDGVVAEGKEAFHSYAYPGTYAVTLTAAYHYSASETRISVEAVAPNIRLLVPGDGSLIVANDADTELEVGDWSLRSSGGAFVIPRGTRVLPRGGIRFAPAVLGFAGELRSTFNFPNGLQAASAVASADSPLRGEPVAERDMPKAAQASLLDIPEGVDIYAPALPAEPEEEGEVRGAEDVAPVASSKPLFWGSLAALGGLLGAGVAATHYLQTRRRTPETLPSVEEFEIE